MTRSDGEAMQLASPVTLQAGICSLALLFGALHVALMPEGRTRG